MPDRPDTRPFFNANNAYERELHRLYGCHFDSARYDLERAMGEPGSYLRFLYDAREAQAIACWRWLHRGRRPAPKPRKPRRPWKRQLKPRSQT